MDYIYFFIGLLVSVAITSFTLIQIGIIIFFGIPITKKFKKQKIIKQNAPIIKGYFVTISILLLFYIGSLLLAGWLNSAIFWGFLCGSLIIGFFAIGAMGNNEANMSDYLTLNEKYLINKDENL